MEKMEKNRNSRGKNVSLTRNFKSVERLSTKKLSVMKLGSAFGKNFLMKHSVDWHKGSLTLDFTNPKLSGALKKNPTRDKESREAKMMGASNRLSSFGLKKKGVTAKKAMARTLFSSLNETASTRDVKASIRECVLFNLSEANENRAATERKKMEEVISDENWEKCIDKGNKA